jgi:hypothetical protein
MDGLNPFQAFSCNKYVEFYRRQLFRDSLPLTLYSLMCLRYPRIKFLKPMCPHPQQPSCPKCGKGFSRKPERNRHIRTSHLPHSIYCPFPRCAWRSGRYEQLTKHWAMKHPNHGPTPGRQQSQIYDADQLVGLVVCGVCTVELVVQFALTEVERRAWELDKAGVWANGWGRRLRPGQ